MTKYVLTLANGRVYEFYVKSCAEMYQNMYGGRLVEDRTGVEVHSYRPSLKLVA
jgi:hypothetical protein